MSSASAGEIERGKESALEQLEKRLKDVYAAGGDRATLDHLYDKWAASYDADLWASGNPYIAILAGMVGRQVSDFDARILDGGCGTGLLGQVLHQIGYTNLVGIDPAHGMLELARQKGCYQSLHPFLLSAQIAFDENSFDAVVAAGVLTHGHAPPESLDEMLKVAKPGAPIIFSISKIAVEEAGFGEKMAQLESAGSWSLLERSKTFRTYPFSEEMGHVRHWVAVYQKASA